MTDAEYELLYEALQALDYCIDDSAELLADKIRAWGNHHLDQQHAMAAALQEREEIADRLREYLKEAK